MLTIPPQLVENLRIWHGAEADRWLAGLPERVAGLTARWRLSVGEPFADGGAVSWVAPVRTQGGDEAVLKVFMVDVENELEGDALQHYDGAGAVRALAAEPGALLLERLRPGTPLWDVTDDDRACAVAMDVLRRLWRPPAAGHRFRILAATAMQWADDVAQGWEAAGRSFERSLVEEARAVADELGPTQGEQVVLHQDLHGANILRAGREPWLAIDPKPLVGEREFDLASLIRDRRWQIEQRTVRRRLDLLSGELGLDRDRMRRWALLHALAWSVDTGQPDPAMLGCARWLAAM
jgi:streptomycin 6-kinase